jgi:hypothetical protein
VESFQRTRGALRFLASCLHSLKVRGGAKPVLGPSDIPLNDPEVFRAMLKDLDPRQDYAPVITHDLVGPNARAKRIDDRMARETPAMANVRPALRLATAILAYSFGGLKREEGSDVLPPGVTETELLAACIGPDLDSVTANSALSDLRNSCLYLHYDGVRYCFKKDPNVTKLIEDAEQEVARDPDSIRDKIKEMLEERLAGRAEAVVWPATSQDLPDKEPRFLVGYMPLDFATKNNTQQDEAAKAMLLKYGDAPRQYRNGIALAVPDKKPLEALRRAVRYLMAIDRVETKRSQHRLTKDQADQLKERKGTENAAAETAFRQLYPSVWLPRVGIGGALELEKIVGGRPLQATGVHERVMELLTVVGTKKVHITLKAPKVVDRMKLGSPVAGEPPRLGVRLRDVQDAFFGFLEPPRIISAEVLQRAVAEGINGSVFAYTTGTPALGPDGKYQVSPEKVTLGRPMSDDEVDLDNGFLIIPAAVPVAAPPPAPTPPGPTPSGPIPPGLGPTPLGPTSQGSKPALRTIVRIGFTADQDQVYKSFPAIANLADKSDNGKISIVVEGRAGAGYDANWLRNAVQEPLDEANIDDLKLE